MNDQFSLKNTLNSIAEFCALAREHEFVTSGLWHQEIYPNKKRDTSNRQYARLCKHIRLAVPGKYFSSTSGVYILATFDEIKEGYLRYIHTMRLKITRPQCPTCGRIFVGVK